MIAEGFIEEPLHSISQISELAATTASPCISIYLSKYSPDNNFLPFSVQLQAALQSAKHKLESQPLSMGTLPLEQLALFAEEKRWDKERGGLAIFCSQHLIRIFQTPDSVASLVHLGNEFYITPLLSLLIKRPPFVVLALSEKHVRVLHCSGVEVHEVDLPASMPRSVDQAGAFDKPDHDLENRSAAGSAPASRRRIHFGTGTAEEKTEEYISHFFRLIDHEMNRLYGREELPLILAAVERELALYKKINSYPHMLQDSIEGSPERVANSELCHTALRVIEIEAARKEERLLSQFAEAQSSGRTLTDISSILTAARRGHIHFLFINEQKTESVAGELLNSIALETLRHGGHAVTFAHHQLPSNSSAAAILRYKATDLITE